MGSVLWLIIVILVLLWAAGFFFVHVGSLIHFLLVIALIVLIYNIVTSRRAL